MLTQSLQYMFVKKQVSLIRKARGKNVLIKYL